MSAEAAGGREREDRAEGLGVDAFALAFESSPTPMIVTDPRRTGNPIVWVNTAFLDLTGYTRHELHGRNPSILQGPLSDPGVIARMREAVAAGEPIECELFNYRKDGTPYWNGMTINPVRDASGTIIYFFSAQADMTEKERLEIALKSANDHLERQVEERTAALQTALEQKTALLHEVDHRVKNNLQVISSLMRLKARRTPPGEARDALQAMAERIGALSTAHSMLYSSGNIAHFDFQEFTGHFLRALTAGVEERVSIESQIEAIDVSAALAAPLALLLHELASNAVRHAFPGEREGRILITAKRSERSMSLLVEDDGVGLEQSLQNPAGFGRTLVELVVRQMCGRVSYVEVPLGTRVAITIPLDLREAVA